MDNSVKTFIKKLQKKKEGFVNSEDGQRSIGYFKGLNSDYAHFIWEIIQNAEDVHATEISFTLKDTHILIRHNGTPFTESNVEAICSILYSDKQLKEGMIGKFGAGFKTVFNYTDAPEVYSGKFSFKITKLIYPEIIPSHPEYGTDTVFILPFINPKKAYSEISKKLKGLSTEALIFLKNISKITVNLQGGTRVITRETKEDAIVNTKKDINFEHIIITDNNKPKSYYRFAMNNMSLLDEDEYGNPVTIKNQSVMIAYRLDGTGKMVPINRTGDCSKYFLFFPTEVESGLEYLVHAPFKSTINRETINVDPVNDVLFDKLMVLVTYSIIYLTEERKVITADFYNQILFPGGAVFPKGKMYDKLKGLLVNTLSQDGALLPTAEGEYAALSELLVETYSVAENKGLIKKIFSVEDIATHITKYKSKKYWDSGYFNTNLYHLIQLARNKLRVADADISMSVLLENMKASWLQEMSNEMLKQFYGLFLSADFRPTNITDARLGSRYAREILPLVRKPDGTQVRADQVYWRKEDINSFFMNDKYCSYFLRNILSVPDYDFSAEFFESIKTKYYRKPKFNIDDNLEDVSKILDGILTKKLDATLFASIPYICGVNAKTGGMKWCTPSEVHLTKETGGSEDVEELLAGCISVYFVHPSYSRFAKNIQYLGINSKIRLFHGIECPDVAPTVENQIRDAVGKISRSKIYIFPKGDFEPNTVFLELDTIMSSMTFKKSLALCKWLSKQGNVIKGTIDWNTNRQNAQSGTSQHGTMDVFSAFGYSLWNSPWIYGKVRNDNEVFMPRKISMNSIREEYLEFPKLLELFGVAGAKERRYSSIIPDSANVSEMVRRCLDVIGKMSEDQKAAFCESGGNLIIESPKKRFEDVMRSQNKEDYSKYEDDEDDEDFIPSPVNNVKRRSEKLQDELDSEVTESKSKADEEKSELSKKRSKLLKDADSDEKTFYKTLDSLLDSNLNYSYTNSSKEERAFLQQEYGGRCQICFERIRKAIPRGSKQFPYHFIARNVIKTGNLDESYRSSEVVDGWNSLSLCPMCAAKYIYCSKNLDSFIDQVLGTVVHENVSEFYEVSIMLDGEEKTICYSPKHMLALQTALKYFLEREKRDAD